MAARSIKLEQLKIDSPCTESWDGMHGDAKSRFCDKCQLHVHNLSAMDSVAAEQLISGRTGRLCIRYAAVGDTLETTDKPIARPWRRWGSMAAMALAYIGFTGFLAFAGDRREIQGDVACPPPKPDKPVTTQPSDKAVGPAIDPNPPGPERVLMLGKMAAPPAPAIQPAKDPVAVAPQAPLNPKMMVMGGMPAPTRHVAADPIVKADPVVKPARRELMGEMAAPPAPQAVPASPKAVDVKKSDSPASTQPSK